MNASEYHSAIRQLRNFFEARGLIEVHTQSRLSILAACEDPRTIATYAYAGQLWPLPQTGQMWLESELLHDPSANGFFCISTSYRNEPKPVPGRHDLIFPMAEFELPGDINVLEEFERELISERVRAGMDRARAEGKRVSRPPLPDATVKQIKKLRRQKKSLRAIAKELDVGLATVSRYAQNA